MREAFRAGMNAATTVTASSAGKIKYRPSFQGQGQQQANANTANHHA
jgi:hypothetical protein